MARNMKENQHVMPIIAEDFSTVTFKVRGHDDLVLHMDKIHPDNLRRAACAGFAQVRIVDAAAVPAADKDGNIIPADERVAMKHDRMAALITHYESGTPEWSRQSEGGGARSITVEAIARVKGVSYEEADCYVTDYATRNYGGDRKECLTFLREGKRVMEAMAAIRAERAPAPKVDADTALDEMKEE